MQRIHSSEPGPEEIPEAIRTKAGLKPIAINVRQNEAAQDEEKIHAEVSPTHQDPQDRQVKAEMHMIDQQCRGTAHFRQ